MHMYMYVYTRRYMYMRMHMCRYVYLCSCMCMYMLGRSWAVVKFVVLLGPQMTADWEPVFAKKTVIPPIAAKDQKPPAPPISMLATPCLPSERIAKKTVIFVRLTVLVIWQH